MRFYLFGLTALLLLSGCGESPDVPLAPKLSKYTTAQQQCNDFLDGKKELTSKVEEECNQFLKRLEKANDMADELANKKMHKGEYDQKKTRYARERNRLKHQYDSLSEAVKDATLAAIKRDDIEAFKAGIAFAGNTYIAPYYDYMKSKAPRFDNDPHYREYQHEESERLMHRASLYLKQGNERGALPIFEEAAQMGNAEAARSTALIYEDINIDLAIKSHLQAADGGVKASYLDLGRLYGEIGEEEKSLSWYQKAAEDGSPVAQFTLYQHYHESDKQTAVSWLKRSSANGYAPAQYTYGTILMKEAKTKQAVDLLLKASQQNYKKASDYLGEYYYSLGLYERAFIQLDKSDSAHSFYLRAKMLEGGKGGYKDYSQAYTFYSRAAAQGKQEAKKDMVRVNALLSKEQQRLAEEEERIRRQQMKKLVKECGQIPDSKNIKKKNVKLHIIGTASAPVGKNSYIIYGDDGEEYFLQRAKGIQESDHVDISATATGKTAILHSSDDETTDVYQFTFIKSCVIEEEQ